MKKKSGRSPSGPGNLSLLTFFTLVVSSFIVGDSVLMFNGCGVIGTVSGVAGRGFLPQWMLERYSAAASAAIFSGFAILLVWGSLAV